MRVSYREGDNNTVLNDVYTGNSEFGIIILNHLDIPSTQLLLQNMHLACSILSELTLHLIARVGHPLTRLNRPVRIEDLYLYDFVLYPQLRSTDGMSVKMAQYEYSFDKIDWERIRHITYVQSRAQYRDLIQRTDTVSFGFQPYTNQETTGSVVSLPLSDEFVDRQNRDINSAMFLVCREGHTLSPLAEQLLHALKDLLEQSPAPSFQ